MLLFLMLESVQRPQKKPLQDASIRMFSSICLVFSRCFWSLIKNIVYTKEDVLSYETCRRCKNLLYVKRSRHFPFLISWHFERSVRTINRNILAEKKIISNFSILVFSYSELFLSWVGRKPPPSVLTDMCRPQSDS